MLFYLALLFVTTYVYWHFVHKRRGLPPGPTPLPIVGNFHELLKEPPGEAVFARWRKQYGDVYTYWMGSLPVIAVNEYKLIAETFQKDGDAYSGRMLFRDFNKLARNGHRGMIFVDGEIWRDQRRFALNMLRDFGFGKNLMQERVLCEIKTIYENIDADISSGLNEHNLFRHVDIAIGSNINALLFGYRFVGERKSEFFELKKNVQAHLIANGHPLVFTAMSNPNLLKRLPFLKEWRRCEGTNEQHFFSHEQLISMCYDLWIAGQETTSNTMAWGFAFMLHNQHVLRRCHEELDKVIGSDRIITLDDKTKLDYCTATINEIMRAANLVPHNILHRATRDVTIEGYKIPKGVAVVPQLSVVLMDEKVFPNPQKFDPERFLDADGKFKPSNELIPFGVGKRACLGEGLARMELFLFFVNIINRYNLLPGKELPSLKRRAGATAVIDPYSCRIEKRKH